MYHSVWVTNLIVFLIFNSILNGGAWGIYSSFVGVVFLCWVLLSLLHVRFGATLNIVFYQIDSWIMAV